MSTLYATFRSASNAKQVLDELVQDGVSSDGLTLVAPLMGAHTVGDVPIQENASSVGDATSLVGRSDDPKDAKTELDYSDLTTLAQSNLSPIDTSNSDTDVDSVDQMSESQDEAERESFPRSGISYGTHESDDVELTSLTDFPTQPAGEEGFGSADPRGQFEDGLEALTIAGFGTVFGGGAFATAVLSFAQNDLAGVKTAVVSQLQDEGVPKSVADRLWSEMLKGSALLAVEVTPGKVREEAVEQLAEQHGGKVQGMYDAPRW